MRLFFESSAPTHRTKRDWDRSALVTDKQIELVYSAGHVEHYDLDYQELSSSELGVTVMLQALEDMSHFYAK